MPYRLTSRGRTRKREIEERIRRAARIVVTEKGIEMARLRDVAEVAGVSTAAICRFAQGRDELLADVVRRVSATERAVLRSALGSHHDPRSAVRAATQQFVDRAFQGSAIAGVLLSGPAMPAIDRARAETRALLADTIVRRIGSEIRSCAIVGAMLSAVDYALNDIDQSADHWSRVIADMCASLVDSPA